MGLFGGKVHVDDGHHLDAETPGSHEALVAADHYVVIVPGHDRLNEAELTERAGEGVELGGADRAGVCGVRVQLVDRTLNDLQVGWACCLRLCHFALRVPSEGMKKTPALLGQSAFIQVPLLLRGL